MLDERGRQIRVAERWEMLYKTPYTVMLGLRLRRIRERRRLTQTEVLERVRRPNGRGYSQAFLSRVEAGYANSPLYAFIHLAEGYDMDPARLLGPSDSEKPVSDAEMTLIRFLRRLGISPDEAMARIVRR